MEFTRSRRYFELLELISGFHKEDHLRQYIILARPHHWVKNVFLLAPLVFSKHLFETEYVATAVMAFIVFCFLSSVMYVINDIVDRDVDRLHPTKNKRPIASGLVTVRGALWYALALFVIVIFLAIPLSSGFLIVAGLYLLLNIFYSFGLKKVILLDVFIVAAGFMLRVLAGAFAIDVEVSHWLVLCTLFISLFLAVSKRRGELLLAQNSTAFEGRIVLREYEVGFLDQAITISAAGMAISYALYTVAERTVRIFGTENLIFTTVFVLFGIFRYLYLMRKRQTEDNPTYLLLTDPVMIVNIAAWSISCILIIYSTKFFS